MKNKKLTVIIRNNASFIHLQDDPTYRSVQIELTQEQLQKLTLRCNTEEINKCFIEDVD